MDDVTRIDNRFNRYPHSTQNPAHLEREDLPYQQRNATRIRRASADHERGVRGAPYVTTNYYNYMERDVVVTSRDGTAIVVPPIGNGSGDEFIVCVTHTMSKASMERALDTLRTRPNLDDRETQYWIRAYDGALHANTQQFVSASVEYVIYWRDMTDASGRCYMPDVDLLVEWVADRGARHPFDKIKRDERTLQDIAPGMGEATFGFMLKAVDNAHQVQRGTRYINVGGDVFMIPVERDLSYPTGIHVVCRKPVDEGRVVSEVINRSYTFEEADKKFGLHRTVEDAINGGPITEMAKGMIERDMTIRKLEESKIRTEQLEVEKTLQNLRNEGAYSKAQQDREAAMRRNYVEWAKTIVAIVGAAITLYGVLSKISAKA